MQILAVSRWSEVFETAESRRHGSLSWISVPVTFNSTGLQKMLDDFEPIKAAALYGAWMALLKVAATAPDRGILAGHKGEPYTPGRLARLSGFAQSLFEELIPWCMKIGWLVDAQPVPGLPDLTGPNQTKPDRTRRAKPVRAVPSVEVLKTQPASGGCESPDSDSAIESATEGNQGTDAPRCGRSETEPQHDRPASVKLIDLLKETELLRKLDAIPVTASGVQIFGRVLSEDRIKREEIERSSTEFWWTWYRDQLGSKQVVLRAGNMLEAVYVLASALAVKRLKRIDNKLALWIKWITARECSSISAMDWRQATERIARFTGHESLQQFLNPASGEPAVARSETGHNPKPEPKSTRPKMTREELKRRAAELRELESAKAS